MSPAQPSSHRDDTSISHHHQDENDMEPFHHHHHHHHHQQQQQQHYQSSSPPRPPLTEWSSGLFREGPLLTPTTNSISDTRYFKVTPHVVDYDDMDDDEKDHHHSVAYDESDSEQVDEFTPVLVEKYIPETPQQQQMSNVKSSSSQSTTTRNSLKIYQARGFNETLYATCCLPCSLADVVKMTQERHVLNQEGTSSWWLICCGACFFPTLVTSVVRGMVRKAFGIKVGGFHKRMMWWI